MNLDCFTTFIESAKASEIKYEIILIESNKTNNWNYDLEHLKVIMPKGKFNFHKFLNIGVDNAEGTFYILSNNDVVFDKNWLLEILKVSQGNKNILSFSPFDANANKLSKQATKNNDYIVGYDIQKHITGWCLVIHKKVFDDIKQLDERFNFYYADNDYAMMLRKFNIKHALVTKAFVSHLEGISVKELKQKKKPIELNSKIPKYVVKENWTWVLENEQMIEGLIQFHNKWGSRKVIKLKLLIVEFLSKFGLGYFNRYVLLNK
ncbi:glycosyltransferase [Flavobacteriaceae bacterium AU392]|nr:glycosyltransferase [Flavobacteriaceae bacterium]RKM82816.1 glycosyltransferase [Flavobacteriaceae bacterium AU392]